MPACLSRRWADSTWPAATRPRSATRSGRRRPSSRATGPRCSIAPCPKIRRVRGWKSKGCMLRLSAVTAQRSKQQPETQLRPARSARREDPAEPRRVAGYQAEEAACASRVRPRTCDCSCYQLCRGGRHVRRHTSGYRSDPVVAYGGLRRLRCLRPERPQLRPEAATGRNPSLAARGERPAAFDRRCIPADGVAPRSRTAGIFPRRALSAGRIASLGATRDVHHGLLGRGEREGRASVSGGII